MTKIVVEKDVSVEEFKKLMQFATAMLGEHKSLAVPCSPASEGGNAERASRRGLCRSDFLATRVYISDRVSDITRPYVSCVIWC